MRTITNGTLKVRLTEPDSGTSIVRNISGPGTTIFHADGSSTLTARGTWFFFFFPGDLGPGSEPMSIVNTGTIADPHGPERHPIDPLTNGQGRRRLRDLGRLKAAHRGRTVGR